MVDHKTIYIVTQGCYSDYSIRGVFDSKNNAELFIANYGDEPLFDDLIIEEWPLNEFIKEIRSGLKCYFVRMTKEGVCLDCREESPETPIIRFDVNKNLFTNVFARDEKHAIKIVNEKRAMIIANNKWGK